MRSRPRRPQFPSRPEGSAGNVTSAIGLEETVGSQRARRNSLFTHTMMWITGLVCIALLLGTLAQAWSNSQLMRKLQTAQQQLQQVQDYHDHLTRLANHYQDPTVIESEARQQLGYIRPGEHPVIIVNANDQGQQRTPKSSQVPEQQGFWLEWWHTFFSE